MIKKQKHSLIHRVDLIGRNPKLYHLSYKRNNLGSKLKQSSISAEREGDPILPSPAISPHSDLRKRKKTRWCHYSYWTVFLWSRFTNSNRNFVFATALRLGLHRSVIKEGETNILKQNFRIFSGQKVVESIKCLHLIALTCL